LGINQKTLELKCPKCQDLIRIRVDRSMLEEAKRLPISVSYIHGDPMHSTTIWVDNDFVIRAVEAPDNTMLGQGIPPRGGQRPTATSENETTGGELLDEVITNLQKALETVGRMSQEIVLALTHAQDELTKLSEIRGMRPGAAKAVSQKKTLPETRRITRKVARTP
jgi:hypothetical protein